MIPRLVTRQHPAKLSSFSAGQCIAKSWSVASSTPRDSCRQREGEGDGVVASQTLYTHDLYAEVRVEMETMVCAQGEGEGEGLNSDSKGEDELLRVTCKSTLCIDRPRCGHT